MPTAACFSRISAISLDCSHSHPPPTPHITPSLGLDRKSTLETRTFCYFYKEACFAKAFPSSCPTRSNSPPIFVSLFLKEKKKSRSGPLGEDFYDLKTQVVDGGERRRY